jgi:hypothetical protein
MDVQQMLDEYAVRLVREIWAFSRDHGEWDTMRACFHPDATVRVLWYAGPVAGFLDETIESFEKRKPGEGSKHWFGNQRAWVKGDRALLESDAQVQGRTNYAGHMFDFTLYIRLYDRMERRQGEWRILRMDAIYDKDRLDPVLAGTIPAGFFDGVDLTGPGAAVALMRWRLAKRGGKVPADLPLGGTDSEKQLRAANEAWLAGRI